MPTKDTDYNDLKLEKACFIENNKDEAEDLLILVIRGEILRLNKGCRMFYKTLCKTIDRDFNKYENVCNANFENGKKGGAPKGNKNALKNNRAVDYVMQNNRAVEKTTETTQKKEKEEYKKEYDKEEEENARVRENNP